MDNDALEGSVALLVSCHAPYPQDPRCKVPTSSPSHLNFVPRPTLGQAQDSPACNLPGCENMHPGEGCSDVGKREDDILWLQEKCGRTEGSPFKTSCPGGWPLSSQKQVLLTCTRSQHFLEASSGVSTKQGHLPCKTHLSNSLASVFSLLVVALFTRLSSWTSDRCY